MLTICLTGSGYSQQHLDKLAQTFKVIQKPNPMSGSEFRYIISSVDAYILGGDERFSAEELSLAKQLRVISFVGTGYSSFIDAMAAKKHHIAIKNTPAVMAPAVTEHTIGMLLGLQRELFRQNWEVKNSSITPCHTEELSSRCVGIIGFGEIGSRIARILRQSFGSDVCYFSRTRKKHLEAELDLRYVSMDTLAASADIIVLALPTTAETKFLINEAFLSKVKHGLILVNTAGAHLVEPTALRKYLDNQVIAAAAFDGYYLEPLPKVIDDPYHLLCLPDNRLIITPHTAAKTTQSWSRMLDMAVDNAITFFNE